MEKSKLLEILYAERERLYSIYKMPGWSKWAIIAAVSALSVQLIDILIQYELDLRYIAAVFFSCFDLLFIFLFVQRIISHNNMPTWGKNSLGLRIASGIILLIFIGQFVWILMSYSYIVNDVLFWSALVLTGIFVFLYLIVFVLGFIETLRTQKSDEIAFLYPYFVFIILLTYVFYFFQYSSIDDLLSNIHAGVYIFAIIFLIIEYNDEHSEKLKKIDTLIEKVLYDDIQDSEKVFDELEYIVLKLRFGKHLIVEEEKPIMKCITSLYSICGKMNLLVKREDFDQADWGLIDKGFDIVKLDIENLESNLEYLKKMMMLSYYDGEGDKYKPMLENLVGQVSKILVIYKTVYDYYATASNLHEFFRYFIKVYDTTLCTLNVEYAQMCSGKALKEYGYLVTNTD